MQLTCYVWPICSIQTILTLVHIRRVHHLFPIRPYLPALVETLEDSDANVRGTAQQSIVELFTGPAVTDAARADLKKEMTKKGTRKGIVESVLAKVLGGSGGGSTPHTGSDAGSENGEPSLQANAASSTNKRPAPSVIVSSSLGASSKPVSSTHREPSRPASRAAALPSPATETGPSGNVDVKPVYVSINARSISRYTFRLLPNEGKHRPASRATADVRSHDRLRLAGIWRTSSRRC